ncbi:rod shape-determining protein [Streptomyces sp. 8K308]|uniref:rod shape-determining protein n=1 Tax=Streptomyces sp. 8K308 TaxID=2530388 RepID=UPI001043814F|nr:rod shape-determining protein [Streptomyces sp. 8K308]TDC20264.1 rod shape-determining protein [Streptomyces sp. 8K308]
MTLSLDHLRRCTLAVDLGAARTRVYLKQSGLIVDEPSVVAVNTQTGALIAVGAPAERMSGRTPANIRVIRPITNGTVVDIDVAQRMLRAMVGNKLRRAWRRKPLLRAAVCIPHDADPLARRAALETLVGVGARRVELVDSLVTAAVGCGLPVEEPEATMIVQCGAATTEVAVLSLGAIVAAEKVPMGGETVDRALMQYLRNEHELLLPSQAVRPLHEALADPVHQIAEVAGRDVATGLARTVKIDPRSLRAAVTPPLTALLDTIRAVLHRCPPDLVADLGDRGVMLTGGAAGLPGLDQMIRQSTGMPVNVAEEPGLCAVMGLGTMLEGRFRQREIAEPNFKRHESGGGDLKRRFRRQVKASGKASGTSTGAGLDEGLADPMPEPTSMT